MLKGILFNIQRFSVNDGPGIRTTVFLKGCPLRCQWCHNPESNQPYPELLMDASKCIGCAACQAVCPAHCHTLIESGHIFRREACHACGQCAQACPAAALEMAGRAVAVDEVLDQVMKDELFYRTSGGGMTVSGGEPMSQFTFTLALLTAAKEKGLHTCLETCGYAPWSHFKQIAPLVDLFLYDDKLTDPALHARYTGVSNERILDNLHRLDAMGARTVLRCPIIPTINDTIEHFTGIAREANSLRNVTAIDIEPYHPLGSGKSRLLGRAYALDGLGFPDSSQVDQWLETLQGLTSVPVRRA